MRRSIIGVPIGTTYATVLPTEFGPFGCVFSLTHLTPDPTSITAKLTGNVSGTVYYNGALPASGGINVNATNVSDTLINVELSGANVAGQLTLTAQPVLGLPEPWQTGANAVQPATSVTGPDAFGAAPAVGTSLLYARGDHDHGLPSLPSSVLASADRVVLTANTLTTVLQYTPTVTQSLLIAVTAAVVNATTLTLEMSANWADVGTQTFYWVNAQSTPAGLFSPPAVIVPAQSGDAVTIQAESTAADTYISASILPAG